MFSSRTDWDFRSSPLFSLVLQKRARGEEIIDLTESNPTRCGFRYQPDHLITPSALRNSVSYEPDPRGLLLARQAIAGWYERQQISVDPSRIIFSSGTSEAYSHLLRLLCNVGESIAVPKPGYPLLEYLGRLNDVDCQQYRLEYDGEWHIDLPSLAGILSPKTKALVLVHPNNPTGSFVKLEERECILEMSKKQNIPLVVDEVFSAFPFGEDVRRAGSFAGTQKSLTFTVNGLSKLVGLPQLKLAWIVVSGPDDLCTKALQRLEVIADTFLSVGTPVQLSLETLLSDPAAMSEQILDRARSNYEGLPEVFTQGSPVSIFRCEGAWTAVLRLPATRTDEEWAQELLQVHSILTHPGLLFDMDLNSCIVVSLLPEPKIFLEGMKGILTAVKL
ncbi:MAG: pyridoxal phosphate-dependent aminotransferase [Ignavibacteria bacterium]|nr:pyridoxal phosphate-dependent aminotransferase [Ignavibacteria bacterium]